MKIKILIILIYVFGKQNLLAQDNLSLMENLPKYPLKEILATAKTIQIN